MVEEEKGKKRARSILKGGAHTKETHLNDSMLIASFFSLKPWHHLKSKHLQLTYFRKTFQSVKSIGFLFIFDKQIIFAEKQNVQESLELFCKCLRV